MLWEVSDDNDAIEARKKAKEGEAELHKTSTATELKAIAEGIAEVVEEYIVGARPGKETPAPPPLPPLTRKEVLWKGMFPAMTAILPGLAQVLMREKLTGTDFNAAPTFEFYEFENSRVPWADQIQQLYNSAVFVNNAKGDLLERLAVVQTPISNLSRRVNFPDNMAAYTEPPKPENLGPVVLAPHPALATAGCPLVLNMRRK
jgi:hypothetical protein